MKKHYWRREKCTLVFVLALNVEMKKRKSLLVEGEILVFRFLMTLVLMVGFVYVISNVDISSLTNSIFQIDIETYFS